MIRATPSWKTRPAELTRHRSRRKGGLWRPRDLTLGQFDVGDFKYAIFEIQIPTVLTVFGCLNGCLLAAAPLTPANKSPASDNQPHLALVVPSKGNVMPENSKVAPIAQHSNPVGS